MLAHYVPPVEKPHFIRFAIDQRVAARVCLARILWLQGFPDEAMRTPRSAVEEARETNHALSLTYALAHGACPIMLWVEDLPFTVRQHVRSRRKPTRPLTRDSGFDRISAVQIDDCPPFPRSKISVLMA
jgi:hypothetical protein